MTLPLELGGIRDPQIQRALQTLAQQFPVVATGGGGGGGAPSGPAGGDLGSTYPNPTVVKGQAGFTIGGVLAVVTSDARLTDARTPTAHHTTHEPGGTDAMAVDAAATTGSLRTIGTGALQATAGNDSRLTNARTPTAHATTHQPGGSDAMAVDAVAATGSLRTLGTGAAQAAAGNDSRLSDARTPTAHATSHQSGGTDALALGSIAGSLVRAQTPLTTKGDLLVTDGTTLHRVGVGANNTVLTADSTQTDGVKWAAGATASNPPVVTSLPGTPADGDEIYFKFTPTTAPTTTVPVFWHLRYDTTTTKWYPVGGASSVFAEVTTSQARSPAGTATYGDLATVGPSITLPLAGDYDVTIGARITQDTANQSGWMSYAIGATAAADADSITNLLGTGVSGGNGARTRRKAGLTAVALVSKYRGTVSGTATFESRWMTVEPVRLG